MSTLRGRIAAVATLVVAAAFVLTGAVIVGTTARAETARLERDLNERLAQIQGAARPGGPGGRFPRPGPEGLNADTVEELRRVAERTLGPGFFLVVQRGGTVLATLGDAPDALPDTGIDQDAQRFTDPDGTTYLVRSVSPGPRPLLGPSFVIGADLDRFVGQQQRALRSRFLLIGTFATAMTGLVTFLVAGLAARPLRRLRQATEEVAATEDLGTRVDVDHAPAEISAVAEGLNTMLARLQRSRDAREAALHAARRFAADAGHELRTPLTAMQSTLDSLQRNPDMDGAMREEMVGEVAEESRRLASLLDSLQALARADAGLGDAVEVVELDEIVAAAAEVARGRHPAVTFTAAVPPQPVRVKGSPAWLRSIVDNLLRNAAVHGRPDGTVDAEVSVTPSGWASLVVDDDGPGIPPAEREEVFRRFTRGADAAARPGSGLGLSLVAQLAALHGGQVLIEDSPSGGARLRVLLPALLPTTPDAQPAGSDLSSQGERPRSQGGI